MKKRNQFYVSDFVMWHFVKLRVLANITWKKFTDQVCKNVITFQTYILTLLVKQLSWIIVFIDLKKVNLYCPVCIDVKKWIYAACIFDINSLNGLPRYRWNLNTSAARERIKQAYWVLVSRNLLNINNGPQCQKLEKYCNEVLET